MGATAKNLNVVVEGERYRTALSYLIADDGEGTFLFRAMNSNYFVQSQSDEDKIEVQSPEQAQELYKQLPNKHQSLVAAFPKWHGGVGMDTASSYDDDDEKDRLEADYKVDRDKAYEGWGEPKT